MIITIQYKNEDGEYQLYLSMLNTNRELVIKEIKGALALSNEVITYGDALVYVLAYSEKGDEMMSAIGDEVQDIIEAFGW